MSYSLAELCIAAGADIFTEEDSEVFATLIGLVPRLAGSLAKKTFLPGLMMSDGEYYFVSEPVPVGKRNGYEPKKKAKSVMNAFLTLLHAAIAMLLLGRFRLIYLAK